MDKELKTKHPLVIGKCAKDSEEGDGYTIFKNTDEELVKKIKSVTIPKDTWIEDGGFMSNGAEGVCRVDKKLNDEQFLCIDEHGTYFIKEADSFSETNRRDLLQKINEEFSSAKILNDSLGPLYTYDGYGTVKFLMYDEYLKNAWSDYKENEDRIHEMHRPYDSMGRVYAVETGIYLDTYSGIHVSYGEIDTHGMFCHINEDGNVVNRDYNCDIEELYLGKSQKTRQDLVEEILKKIPDVNYKFAGNRWYSKKVAFILEVPEEETKREEVGGADRGILAFSLHELSHTSGDTYKSHGLKATAPKKTIDVKRDHILAQILPIINSLEFGGEKINIGSYIDMTVTEIPEEVPKKRIQKTKIDESKFEVFDFTTEDSRGEYFSDDSSFGEIIKAAENFSNGIDQGASETIIIDSIYELMNNHYCLPSCSYSKGEKEPNHSKYKGLIKLPYGVNVQFKIAEGDAVEITWAHSIYETEIVNVEIID